MMSGAAEASADNEIGVVRMKGEASDEEVRATVEEAGYEVNG